MPYVFNPFTGNLDWTADGVPVLTTGGVTFGGTSGEIAQDTQNFNYDNTTDTLGVSSGVTERITNGNFTGGTSGWTVGSGWAYSSNAVSKTANGTAALSQIPSLSLGQRYDVSFTLSNFTTGTVTVSFAGNTLATLSTAGTYSYRVLCKNTTQGIAFTPSNTARLTVDSVSAKTLNGGNIQIGNLNIEGTGTDGVLTVAANGKSNTGPGTTRHALFQNSGSYTWLDFQFSGLNKAHIGASSFGELLFYTGGGNYFSLRNQASGSLYHYSTPTAFGYYSSGVIQGSLNVGDLQTATSTLQSKGGTALKVKYITTNQTLDNSATKWIVDASSAACNGTPTNACSSYTTEAACIARDNHGGCVWSAGTSCSIYDGDESSCTGQTGCTYETADCSAFSGDQSTCESTSGCSWNLNYGDCSAFGDEGTCNSYSGCYWDGSSCSGTYEYYSCDGSYYTGLCIGSFGGGCSGTAACSGIDDQTNCNNEPGCSWSTAVTVTLPNMNTCQDRDYWIYNGSSTNADVIVVPFGSQQINHTTSYTLSNFKDWIHISPYVLTQTCTGLNEATCTTTTGCAANYSNCVWDIDTATCTGDASCSGYSDEFSCNGATYFSSCTGTYTVSENWYLFGR